MSRRLAAIALLFTTCTGTTDANKPATPATPATPAPPATPVSPASPSDPGQLHSPAPTGPIVPWFCVCYSRITAEGGAPLTACRSTLDECHGLEKAVAAGKKGMVARSLTHRCTELRAAHPGDVHGGREVWQPSKKPGSWLSLSACHLPGEGELVQAGTGPNPMGDEVIGGLRIGLPAAEVIKLLGEPGKRGRIEEEGATGEWVQSWDYKDQGVSISMSADTRKGPQTLHSLRIAAPSAFKTSKDIGIGSTRKAVLAAYGKLRDPEDPSGDAAEIFIAGSIYGGVFFTFKADKVLEIFVGAGAE
ncbi:MAG: hypothetical protein IPK80_34845 [Nannocystis sp.]|nr:hypothetical protein [Nannocystis sp.]